MKFKVDDFSIAHILNDYRGGNGTLVVPEYQREYVWTDREARKFILSLLKGDKDLPFFRFSKREGKKYIVDGFQRIHTLYRFQQNELKLSVTSDFEHVDLGLVDAKLLHKKTYQQLSKTCLDLIENLFETKVYCYIYNNLSVPDEWDIYKRVNKGKSHSAGEMIKCAQTPRKLECARLMNQRKSIFSRNPNDKYPNSDLIAAKNKRSQYWLYLAQMLAVVENKFIDTSSENISTAGGKMAEFISDPTKIENETIQEFRSIQERMRQILSSEQKKSRLANKSQIMTFFVLVYYVNRFYQNLSAKAVLSIYDYLESSKVAGQLGDAWTRPQVSNSKYLVLRLNEVKKAVEEFVSSEKVA